VHCNATDETGIERHMEDTDVSNDITGKNDHDDALLRAVRRLPQDIAPRRDLWGGIEAAIVAGQGAAGNVATLDAAREKSAARKAWTSRLSWPYALAAGVGCMALGALLTFALLRSQTAPLVAQAPAPASVPAPEIQERFAHASFGGYEALGPEYEQARAQLAIGLAERLDRLPPEAQQKVERNLDEIRRSLREINVALALDPDSILLQQLLLSTYQSELAMLANVNKMAGEIPARSET
jgi:hypothetical protein